MCSQIAFWIFCAVFVCCDAFVVSRGLDGFIWQFKTEPELKLQQQLIDRASQPKEPAP